MKAVSMKCPNCAAQIPAQPAAQTARCEYCGTTSAIQRRTRFFERVVPPSHQFQQLPLATMPHTRGWAGRIIAMVAVLVAVGVAVPLIIQSRLRRVITSAATGGAGSDSSADYKKQYQWQGMATVILTDVDGDGEADVIGRARYVHQDDTIAVAAWSGKTGKMLWESPRYGNYTDTYQGVLALAGDAVVATDTRGKATAFSIADGSQRWQMSVGEKVERVCGAGDDAVALELADGNWKRLALADGAASAYDAGSGCSPLWMDTDGGDPRLQQVGRFDDYVVPSELEGMRVDHHRYLRPDGPFVALGAKPKGTRVPMIAVYEGELKQRARRGHRRSGAFELAWKTEVPAGDPFAVDEGAPEHATVDGDRLYVVYEMKGDAPHRVAAFQLVDGARLWDAPLTPGSGLVLEGIAATPTRVYVSMWGRLEVLDAATGKRITAIGSR